MITTKIDKQQWRRDVEALLNTDERAFLQRCLAKMGDDQLARVRQFTPEDAAAHLRSEMPTGLTTRKEP